MTVEPILQAEHLVKTFSRPGQAVLPAVDDVSFSLYPGEVLGIIGESGSGKTTLVSLLARLLEVSSGKIFLEGQDITHARGKALSEVYRKMQMVFQSPAESFDPRHTLGDGIAESLRNAGLSRRAARQEAAQLLEKCGLSPDYADRYPHQVSGGQCQRAAIARALAIGPKLLICDEATSALDVTVQQDILALLNRLRTQEGPDFSILFICHDISLVREFCSRVLVMYRGKIIEEGQPDSVIQNPQADYTRRLIESVL